MKRNLVKRYQRHLWGGFRPDGKLCMVSVNPFGSYDVMPAIFKSKKAALAAFPPGQVRRVSIKELAR